MDFGLLNNFSFWIALTWSLKKSNADKFIHWFFSKTWKEKKNYFQLDLFKVTTSNNLEFKMKIKQLILSNLLES